MLPPVWCGGVRMDTFFTALKPLEPWIVAFYS